MKNTALFNEDNRATYCPEDDKLRLYVGRVPREEYDALRAEGWQATAKQDCDFSAVWTSAREDTALAYAGIVEDEDASPQDRAADRAERFSGYLDSNLDRATTHADRYDAGPSAHGFQSYARAVRSADRHDRQASRAVNHWDRAEYWHTRTAGVISHALHLSSPGVRMGRIKTIEAEHRKALKAQEDAAARFRRIEAIAADPDAAVAAIARRYYHEDEDAAQQAAQSIASEIAGHGKHRNPCDPTAPEAYDFEHQKGEHPPTVADYAAHYLATHHAPDAPGFQETGIARYIRHCELRLAYENQMLEAQGGRAASLDMEPGGFIGGLQVHKVNKSPATGRVVSVQVMVRTNGKNQWGNPYPEGKDPGHRAEVVNVERLAKGSYRAPTDEERAAFAASKKAAKAAAPKSTAPPLVNPTMEDAQRLQALFNAATVARWEREHGRPVEGAPSYYTPPKTGEVWQMTQAQYSEASKGSYSKFETREVCALGVLKPTHSNLWSASHKAEASKRGPVLVKVRVGGYEPYQVIHITDKPAKALPTAVWTAYTAPVETENANA